MSPALGFTPERWLACMVYAGGSNMGFSLHVGDAPRKGTNVLVWAVNHVISLYGRLR